MHCFAAQESSTVPCTVADPALIDVSGALPLPASGRPKRVMWLNNDRVFYAGLLGEVSQRSLGGWGVYVAAGAPLRLALCGAAAGAAAQRWISTDLAVLPPNTPHQVSCDDRLICSLLIEPETVDEAALPAWMLKCQGVLPLDTAAAAAMVQRVRSAHARLGSQGAAIQLDTNRFDELFFGQGLAPRRVDARIARVLDQIRDDPAQAYTAQQGATAAGLSFSRFLHLFKAQAGMPFRSLRSWKRARSLLHHVTRDAHLVHVALDTGYPDSTHFSHSIRQVYGLKPRDLFAGSRRLTVLGDSPAARAAARAERWR